MESGVRTGNGQEEDAGGSEAANWVGKELRRFRDWSKPERTRLESG
jgi:hypothetical protein